MTAPISEVKRKAISINANLDETPVSQSILLNNYYKGGNDSDFLGSNEKIAKLHSPKTPSSPNKDLLRGKDFIYKSMRIT